MTAFSAFRSIVFDLDGTLIDSVPASRAALNIVLAEDGLAPLGTEEVRQLVGDGARAMVTGAFACVGGTTDSADIDRRLARYLAVALQDPARHVRVYPGVVEVLEQFRDAGVPMAVCTNKPRVTTHAVLQALDLAGFFAAVLCAEDVAHRKPDGRHILAALDAMRMPADGAVMVGDSETDIAAAADAGIPVVAVSYGYCHVPLSDLPVDAVVDSFSELPPALARVAAARTGA